MTMIMESKGTTTRVAAPVTRQVSPTLSIIIPTLNEAQNIGKLLLHLHRTMQDHKITYEAIIVDDHSSDETIAVAESTAGAQDMPVRVLVKQGKPGKTYSVMEGLDAARYEALAMMDGDLQYPPESLPDMLDALRHADIVVGDRRASYRQASLSRGRFSHIFNVAIGRGILSLDTDVQSGMKVMRREVYETSLLRPGPWSFDLELLTTAKQNGYRIANVPIEMHVREGGESKVRVLRLAFELGMRALAIRYHLATHTPEEDIAELAKRRASHSTPLSPAERNHQAEQIRAYERWLALDAAEHAYTDTYKEVYAQEASESITRGNSEQVFRPFAPHRPMFSAITTFQPAQIAALVGILLVWALSLARFGIVVLTATLGLVTALYLFDLGVTMMISLRTLQRHPVTPIDDRVVRGIRKEYWPSYTILCPLYHEAEVATQFAHAMCLLDYPEDRLQVLLLTEEDDQETRNALLRMDLPAHFEVITVPDGSPRTKPRACNYGLTIATGSFIVIFDAEDIPDPLQLKKAVLTFAQHDEELACAQASLTFYNPSQNLLTRWFTSEYALWFGLTLPALQRMKTFLPLGGTSNHFRTNILREVGGWDPFNVTEDCDLGVRLAEYGYRTAMIDSTTYEEANPNLKNWIRQRSRWIKGYMQTYLVYMRNPLSYIRNGRLNELFWLQVIIGGRPLTQLFNPILWLMLLAYVVFNAWVTPIYHVLYPPAIFYAAVTCLVFGNFFYVYSYLIGCLSRRQYLLTFWSLFIPLYWALMSVASYIALYQLITRPFYWEKTKHGLSLKKRASWAIFAAITRWIAPARRERSDSRPIASQQKRSGQAALASSGRSGGWRTTPLVRGVADYVDHEVMVMRRDIARSGRQHAALSPTISLPVAPVVDMLSTGTLPAIQLPAGVAEAEPEQSTGYLVALHPMAPRIVPHGSQRRPSLMWMRDGWLIATLLTAITTSVIACLYFFSHGETLLFSDAESHMRIARMPFDGVTTGIAQLGAGWLPLPHILMWPFIMNDYLWSTGLAGAFVGMGTYVIATIYAYRIARLLTGSGMAAFVGSLVLLLNPNLLYLQSTPMSEPVLMATMAATIYYVVQWTRTDQTRHLLQAAFAALLTNLTRYEGWTLFAALILIVMLVNAFKRRSVLRIIGEALLFATPGTFGIGMWVLWNDVVTGNPLFFLDGPFSAQSQQAGFLKAGQLPTYHNLGLVILTYGADVLEFVGPVIVVLALVGAILYAKRAWRRPEGIAALALIAPLALYLVSLYSGQTVIYVPLVSTHVANDLFNVRYATSALLPVAVFVATLVGKRRLLQLGAIALIIAQTALTSVGGVIALQDGQHGLSCLQFKQSDIYLAEHYNSGRILDDIYVNAAAFDALGIHYSNVVNVGSYKVWDAALANPGEYVDWIIMRPGDAVSPHINVNNPTFISQFELVEYDASGTQIFHKRGLAPLPNRPEPVQLMRRYAQCNPQYKLPSASSASGASGVIDTKARDLPHAQTTQAGVTA